MSFGSSARGARAAEPRGTASRARSPTLDLGFACPIAVLLALVACGPATSAPDGADVDPAPLGSGPQAPSGEPRRFAPGVVTTDGFELGTAFTPDGRTVLFAQIGDGFATSRIVASRWQDGGWSEPEPLPFTGPYRDLDPFVSPDGMRLVFQSDRPLEGETAGDWNLWISDADAEGWGPPRALPAPVNSPGVETFPVLVADGSLYFSSDRPGGEGGDVYRAPFVDGEYGEPERLPAPINTAGFDSNVWVSPDESFLILAGERGPEHRGAGDLYLSRFADGRWSEPVHLGGVSTPARELAPAVSPDGHVLYFTSDRPDAARTEKRRGDIYEVDLESILPP